MTDYRTGSAAEPTRVVYANEYISDSYFLALRLSVIQSIIIIGLIASMFYIVHVHQPENRFFATTEDGRMVPKTSLETPNLSRPGVASWSAMAVIETMTFGFHDYQRRLQESSRHFTPRGWESFLGTLQTLGTIETIESRRLSLVATLEGAPSLKSESLKNGRYQWVFEVPVRVQYFSGDASPRVDHWDIRLVIVRVPRLENSNGVGIESWEIL